MGVSVNNNFYIDYRFDYSSAVPGQHSAVKMTATVAAAAVAQVMRLLSWISTSAFLSRAAFSISYRPTDPIKAATF